MEMILFTGIQATGKSSFYLQHFYRTHVRINLDMLNTRFREQLLLKACIDGKTKCVVDNTNLTREERARYIAPAKQAGFTIIGYFFQSRVADALQRNSRRTRDQRVPDKASHGASGRLELPSRNEGYDQLHFVRMNPDNSFTVEEWKD